MNNILPMPKPEQDLAKEFEAQVEVLVKLLRLGTFHAWSKLEQAEAQSVEKISNYTPQDRMLTLDEAAAYLKFKPRTIRSWCNGKHPTLQHSTIGGELRFRKSWLDAYVDRNSPVKIKPITL